MSHCRGKLLVPLESLNEANSLKWIFSSVCTQQSRNQECLHTCSRFGHPQVVYVLASKAPNSGSETTGKWVNWSAGGGMDRGSPPPKPPSAFEGSIQNRDFITPKVEVFSHSDMFTRVVLRKTGSKMRHLGTFSWRTFLDNTGLSGSFSLAWMLQFMGADRRKEWEGWGRAGGKAVGSPRFKQNQGLCLSKGTRRVISEVALFIHRLHLPRRDMTAFKASCWNFIHQGNTHIPE